jgi:putative peptide zinc metalloprotease protein
VSTVGQPVFAPDLASRFRQVRVGVRQDLEVTRQLFRGQPAYIVRDPVTFQSHRLEPADYQVFVSIDPARSLGEIFDDLVAQGLVGAEDEGAFYEFIVQLHRMSFLNLPISDEKLLYRRYLARQRAKRKGRLTGILFLRIPLVNPDAFLERTVKYVRPAFGRAGFLVWLAVVVSAAVVMVRNWGQLVEPLQGVLAARNLPLVWFTLIALKVFHELGHAYACKHYGGYVPEMGAFFLVFTPCAYVDATSVWGFSRMRHRLIVCLAGMYFESFIAAIAVFIWAATGPSLLNSLAYNVIFLAGVVTILFNINPLMRYDGYYVLSDLVEIPNLRARSTKYVGSVLKRVFLGVPINSPPKGLRLKAILLTFGVAATIYRSVLLFTIAALVASKMFLLGIGLAAAYFCSSMWGLIKRFVRYLWQSEETARVRVRAVALSLVALVGIPGVVFLLPVRANVQAAAVVATEKENVVRAGFPGFVSKAPLRWGQEVRWGDLLVTLSNDVAQEQLADAEAAVQATEVQLDTFRVLEPARVRQLEENLKVYQLDRRRRREELQELRIMAPAEGRVVDCLRDRDLGRFVMQGEPVATIVSGKWRVRAILTEQQMLDAQPEVGDTIEFRPAARPGEVLAGRLQNIAPAGTRTIRSLALTQLAGGNIAVDPLTGQADQPYFELTVDLDADDAGALRYGMTGTVRLPGQIEPVGYGLVRSIIRFTNSLMQS